MYQRKTKKIVTKVIIMNGFNICNWYKIANNVFFKDLAKTKPNFSQKILEKLSTIHGFYSKDRKNSIMKKKNPSYGLPNKL